MNAVIINNEKNISDSVIDASPDDTLNNHKVKFKIELINLINMYSLENGSDTPDFILGDYIMDCIDAYDKAKNKTKQWEN